MNLMRGINLKKIARQMKNASGAELKVGSRLLLLVALAHGSSPQGVCTEAGMFALRERRIHVTQEDFEMAVAKVMKKDSEKNMSQIQQWL